MMEKDVLEVVEATKRLNPAMQEAWEIAASRPPALYCFMQGFVAFNFYAAPSATRLAANLKLMDMNDVASAVFAALPDEYGRLPDMPDHRTLALGLLSIIGDYANLSAEERNAPIPEWHREITDQLQQLYQGKCGDRSSLIRAVGAHWASERLADIEYAAGDRIVRQERKGYGLDRYIHEKYLKKDATSAIRYEMQFGQWTFDPWAWIKFHGCAEGHALEFQHFLQAQNAVNAVLEHAEPDISEQAWQWICEGAREFASLQNRFFTRITEDCEAIRPETHSAIRQLAG